MAHILCELDIVLFFFFFFFYWSYKQLLLRIAPSIEVIVVRVCHGSESMSWKPHIDKFRMIHSQTVIKKKTQPQSKNALVLFLGSGKRE